MRLAQDKRQKLQALARAALFALGAISGAAGLAVGLSVIGAALSPAPWVVVGVTAVAIVAVIAREVFALPVPLVQRRWQVPGTWLKRRWLGVLGFGAVMGVGVFTYTPSLVFYVYLLANLLSRSLWAAAFIGMLYGACFAAGTFGGTTKWRFLTPGEQADRAFAFGRKAALAGALASPLVLASSRLWIGVGLHF